tara:strand:- start:1124 stop:1327 length:204 start_codon:yes stop_codon:yes gene_type:complete
MEHPLHDDSHIPAAIESTEERIEALVFAITEEADIDALVEWSIQYLTNHYENNENAFQIDWKDWMEN